MADLYLASQSPRRRELLSQIAVQFQVVSVNVPEVPGVGESPVDYVTRLALEKSQAGWRQLQQNMGADVELAPVLGADTLIELDGRVLEKPVNEADGVAMLAALSGREHRVLSAVALTDAGGSQSRLSVTKVQFRRIDPDEAHRYWQTGEPQDKAGGYAIQGLGAVFVEQLCGSYSGVVGLPLAETRQLLDEYAVAYWQGDSGKRKKP